MAKRTINSQYQDKDAALSTTRQILSGDTDLAEIYYDVAPYRAEIPSSNDSVPPPPYTPSQERPQEPTRAVGTLATRPSAKKPDVPISAFEIVVGIIAQKLKKTANEIAVTSTIKSLVSGMSSNLSPSV